MKQLKLEEHDTRDAFVREYLRLSGIATESRSSAHFRARPNWYRLYEAHEEMAELIHKLRQINGH